MMNLGFHISPDITIEFVKPKSDSQKYSNSPSEDNDKRKDYEDDDDNEPYFNPLIYCAITMDEEGETSPPQNGKSDLNMSDKFENKPKKFAKNLQSNENSSFVCNSSDAGSANKTKKRFSCPVCPKTFGWTTDLKRHILIHTGERPFKCSLCFATFTRNFLLQKHKSKIHQCLSPNEISQLNNNVAKNLMEIKMKMRELEEAKSVRSEDVSSEDDKDKISKKKS